MLRDYRPLAVRDACGPMDYRTWRKGWYVLWPKGVGVRTERQLDNWIIESPRMNYLGSNLPKSTKKEEEAMIERRNKGRGEERGERN